MTACLDDNAQRTREKREGGVLNCGTSVTGLCATLPRWNAQVHTIFSLSNTGELFVGKFL